MENFQTASPTIGWMEYYEISQNQALQGVEGFYVVFLILDPRIYLELGFFGFIMLFMNRPFQFKRFVYKKIFN